ncbi:MAG: CHAD domain-containing protein [Bacteroidales bacterium]|nr:CHAD domain-containing protein [Bacteroidales bacterium]
MKKAILHYIEKQQDVFKKHYKKAIKKFDAEAIHKIRLGVKKLRTVFRFLEYLDPGGVKAKKSIKHERSLFKSAGVIRELQVQQELVTAYEKEHNVSLEEYKKHLAGNEEKARKDLKKNKSRNRVKKEIGRSHKQVRKVLKKHSNDQIHQRLIDLIEEKFNLINILNAESTEGNRHKMRTQLKQIHYLLGLLDKDEEANRKFTGRLDPIYETEQKMGQWHDKIVCLDHLQEYFYQFPEAANDIRYQDLITYWNNQKKELWREIDSELKDLNILNPQEESKEK